MTEEKNFKITIESKNPQVSEVFKFDSSKDKEYIQYTYRIKALMKMRVQILGIFSKNRKPRKENSVYDPLQEGKGTENEE